MHLCQLFLLTLHYRNKRMEIKEYDYDRKI